jgi:uncharacterized protein with von Willebrand factor type A (vWA) domain
VSANSLLDGIDKAIFSAAFVGRLRKVGLPVSIHSAERLAEALACASPTARTELYWICRVCLVHDVRSIELFDRVFDVVFEGGALPVGRNARGSGKHQSPAIASEQQVKLASRNQVAEGSGGVPWSSSPSAAADDASTPDDEDDIVLPELLPSSLADLADTPFDQLSDLELATIGGWLEEVIVRWPTRRARRVRHARSGPQLDRRRTLSNARRTGGDPVELVWQRQIRRPRKVVMLADVSGSMQTFVRPYMHVMRALTQHVQAETFAFSTTLTRVTPALRHQDPQEAIEKASELVDDRFSGTKIAASFRSLMSHPTWSTSVRGAVVLIASDGWDTDPPEELARAMSRLERMSHRIVWVNPRSAADEFEPLVAGMAAALPHCTTMLSGHSLRAMRDVIIALGSTPRPSG